MIKRIFLPFLALLALLTSCGGKAQMTAIPLPTGTRVPPTEPFVIETTVAEQPGCTVISAIPTPGPTERSLFPPVSDVDWVIGDESADVTIMEYSDFQ